MIHDTEVGTVSLRAIFGVAVFCDPRRVRINYLFLWQSAVLFFPPGSSFSGLRECVAVRCDFGTADLPCVGGDIVQNGVVRRLA